MADRVGNQLVVPADVKLDGILVGRVSGVHVDGNHAVMTLQIDKSHIKEIPADVQARILPKTLFGEKFVSLVVPDGTPTGAPHINAGGVIEQDHSKTAIELQTVFNDLVPMLRALKPAELSIALSNLADALHNRGNALGTTSSWSTPTSPGSTRTCPTSTTTSPALPTSPATTPTQRRN